MTTGVRIFYKVQARYDGREHNAERRRRLDERLARLGQRPNHRQDQRTERFACMYVCMFVCISKFAFVRLNMTICLSL